MPSANRTSYTLGAQARLFLIIVLVLLVSFLSNAQDRPKVDHRQFLLELERLAARKPFLIDSPDVYLEPQSLNHFFTEPIYRLLQGNAYFGYTYDEGFHFEGKTVQIEIIKDLTPGEDCRAAYRVALEQALAAATLEIKPQAPCRIGLCIVGMEPKETAQTLPGIMVEAYLRNPQTKKSFFIRYAAGTPRPLQAALRLSAKLLVAHLQSRQKSRDRQ